MYQILLLTLTLIILIFFLRSIPTFHYDKELDIEGFTNGDNPDDSSSIGCYNKIVKRGEQYYLFNSKTPLEVRKNPIVFSSLEDYANWERKKSLTANYDCPILYYNGKDDSFTHDDERMVTRDGVQKAQSPMIVSNNQGDITIDEYGKPISKPYVREQINSLDDYEYNRIFGNGNAVSIKQQNQKDEKLQRLHNDPMIHHKTISYDDEKQMIDPGMVTVEKVALSPQEQILESQRMNSAENAKVGGKFNPLVEDNPEEIKKMYLKEHPEVADCKLERNGYNSYSVVEVTPKRESNPTELAITRRNRPDEKDLVPEDLRSYGGSAADPNKTGLRYLSPDSKPDDYTNAVERMFAPSIPRKVWYQEGGVADA